MIIIPPWVSSQSYIVAPNAGMTIISNQLTHKIILLRDESAVIWSWFEQGTFSFEKCLAYLRDRLSENPKQDVENFLSEMLDEQCLADSADCYYRSPNPPPTPQEVNITSSITPVINEEDKALEDEVSTFAEEHGFLFSAFWEVTNRCNEKCVHCFNPGAPHADSEKANRDTQELTTEEGFKLIDSFRKAGAYRLILSGGEVFLRRDIFELIQHARNLHMQVHIFTNGIILNDERLEKLVQTYPESVSVSLYSASAEVHDQITRVPGSFQKSVSVLQKLRGLGIKTTVKAIQMQHTVQGYGNVEKLARSLGSRTTVELNMSAGNDGAQGPISLAVSDESELIALAATKGSPIFVGDISNNFGERHRNSNGSFCSAGRSMMSVTSDGKVYPCVALPLEIGTLADSEFHEIWQSSQIGVRRSNLNASLSSISDRPLSKWQSIRISDYKECGTHDRCSWCHKCPGMSLNETGDALNSSIVQCRIAYAKMQAAKLLREGKTQEQIYNSLGISEKFGFDIAMRPIPEIPIKLIPRNPLLMKGRE